MLTSVLLLAALSPAADAPGKLALFGTRLTYGPRGPARADSKLLPGDALSVAFDIEGLTADEGGKVRYSTALEVTDSQGKSLFKQAPRDQESVLALGGNVVPAFAQINVGLDQPEGSYTATVTVTDLATKSTQTLTQKFEVQPRGFGIIRVGLSSDPDGQYPLTAFGPGQSAYVSAVIVGFTRDGTSHQPALTLTLRALDDKGKPTTAKPFSGSIEKEVPEKALSVPIQFGVPLNRAGSFTVEMTVTDRVSKKTATVTFPLTVQGAR
jgi:hypothetical protein